ncbi:MAG: hypothetical protein IJJ66_03250, partial [Treponema sp.]|nr:hypothetical protein [Treponema sp.]
MKPIGKQMACYNISYGQNNAVFPCNSFPSFSLLAQRKFAASEQKRTCSFFRARANFTEGNRAKRNGVCGGGKKSCPLRKPAGGTTQSASLCIVLSPQPCYGRRIFSFTPHVSDMTLTTCEIQRLQQWQDATMVTDQNQNVTQDFMNLVIIFLFQQKQKEKLGKKQQQQ